MLKFQSRMTWTPTSFSQTTKLPSTPSEQLAQTNCKFRDSLDMFLLIEAASSLQVMVTQEDILGLKRIRETPPLQAL
jgi:hypothetical protein